MNTEEIDINSFIDQNKSASLVQPEPYDLIHDFIDFQLDDSLNRLIEKAGYEAPTEIQDKSIPSILEGRDLIGIAGTGTGKTAAFLIPIIQDLIELRETDRALVIAPTRELATQIMEEFIKLTRGLGLYATALIGGVNVGKTIKALHRTNHLIVATPGRLIDMADRGHVDLGRFKVLVLDEFDRMLDMGFSKDVKGINDRMRSKEQTLLFSATMDKTKEALVDAITRDAVRVSAGVGTERTTAISQEVVYVPKGAGKMEILHQVMGDVSKEKVLLFCKTKRQVNQVHKNLLGARIDADLIHGNKTQSARDKALRKFRNGQVQVLVATDVVARGIDVSDITMVINYEIPQNYNDYIHRIGRTGRAGKSGRAITLINQ